MDVPLWLLVEQSCVQIALSERIADAVTDTKSDDPVGHHEPDDEQNQPHALKVWGPGLLRRVAAARGCLAPATTPNERPQQRREEPAGDQNA